MDECSRLESGQVSDGLVGSNPTPSATLQGPVIAACVASVYRPLRAHPHAKLYLDGRERVLPTVTMHDLQNDDVDRPKRRYVTAAYKPRILEEYDVGAGTRSAPPSATFSQE